MAGESKAALITGGARGIGKGIVLELARNGWDVAVNYVSSRESAEATVAECLALGVHAVAVGGDVGDTMAHASMLDATLSAFGRIDLLVNNAGVAPSERRDLLEATEESFDRLIRTNLRGPYFLTQRVANHFVSRDAPADGPRGMIINVSSISVYTASTNRGDYCVSKAGVAMATALFADRLAEFGIPVFEVRPGVIRTDMTSGVTSKYDALIAEGLTPIRRWGTPQDVGKAVAALAQGNFPFSTGDAFNVDGGFHLRRL